MFYDLRKKFIYSYIYAHTHTFGIKDDEIGANWNFLSHSPDLFIEYKVGQREENMQTSEAIPSRFVNYYANFLCILQIYNEIYRRRVVVNYLSCMSIHKIILQREGNSLEYICEYAAYRL